MPKRILPLTDYQVKNAKPKDKDYKLSDGGGLYMLVTTSGGKLWRLDYRFEGKRKTLYLKSYPEKSLADARKDREDARTLLVKNVDPGEVRKNNTLELLHQQQHDANTFERVAREWITQNQPVWSASHVKTLLSRLERFVFPVVGNIPFAEVERVQIKNIVVAIGAKGIIETADRVKTYCQQIFRYALNQEYISSNPILDMKDLLPKREAGHHAAFTEPKPVAELLRAIDDYEGYFVVKKALQFAPHVFVRPGELRKAEWAHIDLETAEWRFYITKTKTHHIVPLSSQALAILKELQPLTGGDRYVFPCHRTATRPMSENALIAALRRMGFTKEEMTPHGFRAMARTMIDEILEFPVDILEHQLAHAVKDANGRAYNRTTKLPQRKKMMQAWSDYLDDLKSTAKVVTIKKAA